MCNLCIQHSKHTKCWILIGSWFTKDNIRTETMTKKHSIHKKKHSIHERRKIHRLCICLFIVVHILCVAKDYLSCTHTVCATIWLYFMSAYLFMQTTWKQTCLFIFVLFSCVFVHRKWSNEFYKQVASPYNIHFQWEFLQLFSVITDFFFRALHICIIVWMSQVKALKCLLYFRCFAKFTVTGKCVHIPTKKTTLHMLMQLCWLTSYCCMKDWQFNMFIMCFWLKVLHRVIFSIQLKWAKQRRNRRSCKCLSK